MHITSLQSVKWDRQSPKNTQTFSFCEAASSLVWSYRRSRPDDSQHALTRRARQPITLCEVLHVTEHKNPHYKIAETQNFMLTEVPLKLCAKARATAIKNPPIRMEIK